MICDRCKQHFLVTKDVGGVKTSECGCPRTIIETTSTTPTTLEERLAVVEGKVTLLEAAEAVKP